MKTTIRYILYLLMGVLAQLGVSQVSLAQTVPLVFDVENRTPANCNTTFAPTGSSNTYLPDPFKLTNGSRVATFDDWTCRRNQIKSNIEHYEIGMKPSKPSNITATYSNGVLTVRVTENGQTLTLTSNVTTPSGSGPFPVVIGMNSRTGSLGTNLFSDVIQIPFNHDQVVTYANGSGSINANDPYFKLYPNTNIGKYSAWSWGISRLIDGIEIVKSQMNADTKRIAVTGCSYAGKMALFAGAFDERIALTIAQESGGGGINAWRTSQAFTSRTGTNIEKIDNTNYSWFKGSMRTLNPNTLPHDHHELIAMIAPRAFLALGNPGFEWLGDESGYKSCMAAIEVWKAMGVEDRFGFDFTGGHNHCAAANTQNNSVTAFVNKFLKNNTSANTNIRINPSQNGFNLTMNSVINWTTPTITFTQSNPNAPTVSITSPTDGSIFEAGAGIPFHTRVTDANNDVTKVEFFSGSTKLGESVSAPYSFIWTNATPGAHTITAKATDARNLTGTSGEVRVTVRTPRAPFNGAPHAIPGRIEAEEYDLGGEGVGFHEVNAGGNEGGATFRNDEVDIEVTQDIDGGYNVGYILRGEWLAYTVHIEQPGAYDLHLRVAVNGGNRAMRIEIDDQDISGPILLPNTEGWQNWQTITVNDLIMPQGEQVMKLVFDSDYLNVNYMVFEPVTITATPRRESVSFDYFPNPYEDFLTVTREGHFDYQLTDISGNVMESGSGADSQRIGRQLPQGLYFLKIQTPQGSGTEKIVKK